jgi:hypothetical protein
MSKHILAAILHLGRNGQGGAQTNASIATRWTNRETLCLRI